MLRSLAKAAAAGVLVVGASGCSFLLDWNDFTGDAAAPGDATSGGAEAGADASIVLVTCGADQRCVPDPPVGWMGPLTLYEGPQGVSVPACSDGYQAAPAYTGNGGFNQAVGAPKCTACSCSPGGATC